MHALEKVIIQALAAIACFAIPGAHADPNYRCTIAQRISASPESPSVRKAQERAHLGKQFTVDRNTGVMTGVLKNAYVVDPQVVDFGSGEHAYKVVTAMKLDDGAGFGSNVYALTVNEQEDAALKSFVFLENDKVYLGQCEHF